MSSSTSQSDPSLDLGKNKSTGSNEPVDGRYDCREIYYNFYFQNSAGETANFRCNQWDCYCCGYRMRMNLIEEIKRVTNERPEMCRLLTLTLDPDYAPSDPDQQHEYITQRWNALRTAISREIGDFSYIWVREEQESGLPHLHLLVSRFLPQDWLSARWDELGGGEIVDIRMIERTDKAAHYIGKYLTKDALSGLPDGIRRYGSSSDIDLEVRDSSVSTDDWALLMDDYEVTTVDGDEPIARPPTGADFVQQRENGPPEPPP